jgi:hypothetical protein
MCDRSHLSERAIDSRARRAARRAGLFATKSRGHSITADNLGGYMLLDGKRYFCIAGSRFDLTAEDVIEWCREDAP